jgi:hypothetical protein
VEDTDETHLFRAISYCVDNNIWHARHTPLIRAARAAHVPDVREARQALYCVQVVRLATDPRCLVEINAIAVID